MQTRRIAPESLDPHAVQVIRRLREKGFEAYLVGGCVRDLLLGHEPKDFDLATSARPNQIKRLFRNCRIIGRRFKLAHIHFGSKILEVSTFRRTPGKDDIESDEDPLIRRDNEFGTAQEDACRRDFTINGLFYDPSARTVIDWVGGLDDLHKKQIRTINDPILRFREDPVRIIRAVKFASRLHLDIEKATWQAMKDTVDDLSKGAPPRILEEIFRLLGSCKALGAFQLLRQTGALAHIMTGIDKWLDQASADERNIFWRHLDALDTFVAGKKEPVENHLLLSAAFLHPVVTTGASQAQVNEEMIADFAAWSRLSRRDRALTRRLCTVQHRFTANRRRFKVSHFITQEYFPQALDLFHISCLAKGGNWAEASEWRCRLNELTKASTPLVQAIHQPYLGPTKTEPLPVKKAKPPIRRKKKTTTNTSDRKQESTRATAATQTNSRNKPSTTQFNPNQTMAPTESRCVIPDYTQRDLELPEKPQPE